MTAIELLNAQIQQDESDGHQGHYDAPATQLRNTTHADTPRPSFEAWAAGEGYLLRRKGSGRYFNDETQQAWIGYRAGFGAGYDAGYMAHQVDQQL